MYLNTGRPVVFGVRPEDFHDEEAFITNSKDTVINVKVDVVEKLGAETLLYCVFSNNEEEKTEDDGRVKSLVDSATQMIAKVDSRSKTERDQVIELGIDIMHSHLFDKESELTILEGEGTKAYVPVVELERRAQRAKEEAEKANAPKTPKFPFGKKKEKKVENETAATQEATEENTTTEE